MKLERLHEYTLTTAVIGIGMGLALAAGQASGAGQMKSVGIILGGIFLLGICLSLRTSIWLIIPFCWNLGGTVPASKLPFSVHDVAIMLAFGSYVIFYALKQLRYKPKFEVLDLLILLNIVNLGTVFLRNPVGLNWLGSDLVGGKPYFDIFVAFLAYYVICRAPADLRTLKSVPIFFLLGAALSSLFSLVSYLRPSLGGRLSQLYSGFAPAETDPTVMTEDVIGRKPALAIVGNTGVRVWTAYFNPITFLDPRYPFRFLGMAAFMLAILFSGFRNAIFSTFVFIAMSCYFRKRFRDVALFVIIGSVVMAFLAVGNNRVFSLPLSMQRALSFLPGEWDYTAASDAKGSTAWRHEIWRMALFEEGWIRNKWLGDGFGFTKHQLSIMTSRQGYVGGAGAQEAFLVAGNYHSGPISTIRYAGVVGLVLLLPLAGLQVVRGYRLIRKCYGTPLFPAALFFGLPMIYFPFPFIFIAGGFDSGLIELIFSAGMLKLLERGLGELQAQPESATPSLTRVQPIAAPAFHGKSPRPAPLPRA